MGNNKLCNISIILMMFCVNVSGSGSKRTCFYIPAGHVFIGNNLPTKDDNVKVHCRSEDDDLGMKRLGVGQVTDWGFCVWPYKTLFYCDVWWGCSKHAAFHAFDAKLHVGKNCYWLIRADGLYFSEINYSPMYEKLVDWD
ncbi:hypothetical protein OROMI_007353 [Orobanche minor]